MNLIQAFMWNVGTCRLDVKGETLPNPETLYSFTTPFNQASILISQLAKNIPTEKRLEYAKVILLTAVPLPFSVECLSWFRSGKEKDDSERIFKIEDEDELGKLIAQRIASVAKDSNIYLKYGKDAPIILWTWSHYESKETTETYLKEKLDENSKSVTELLKTFITTAWGMESGLPIKGNFKREQYDYLSKIVNPKIVFNTIKLVYGDEFIESFDPSTIEDKNFDEKITFQFLQIHQLVLAELIKTEKEAANLQNQAKDEDSQQSHKLGLVKPLCDFTIRLCYVHAFVIFYRSQIFEGYKIF